VTYQTRRAALPGHRFFSECSRQPYLLLVGLGLLSLFVAVASADEKPTQLIGYTEGRNDLEGGTMQLYVATTDGKDSWPITNVPAGSCAMHGHWHPIITKPGGLERAIPKEKPSGITPPVMELNGVLGVEYRSGDLHVGWERR
jgi:hypothetical protein